MEENGRSRFSFDCHPKGVTSETICLSCAAGFGHVHGDVLGIVRKLRVRLNRCVLNC